MEISCCKAGTCPNPRPVIGARLTWLDRWAHGCLSFGPNRSCTRHPRFKKESPPNADLHFLRTISERLASQTRNRIRDRSPDGKEPMNQEAVTQFKSQLRGDLIDPTAALYDAVRKVN